MTYNQTHLRQTFLMAMGLALPLQACGPKDMDSDGYVVGDDCNDSDAMINPGASEVCDEVDNNCDGVVDADATDRKAWYADNDRDGYGDPEAVTLACLAPVSSVADMSDCAPELPEVHPDAEEITGDRIDNDCDSMVDEMSCPEAIIPANAQAIRTANTGENLKFCMDMPSEGVCPEPSAIDRAGLVEQTVGSAPTGTAADGGSYAGRWVVGEPICGPDESNSDSCCYQFPVSEQIEYGVVGIESTLDGAFNGLEGLLEIGSVRDTQPMQGRPLVVHGSIRTATTARSSEWSTELSLPPLDLTASQRRKIGQVWRDAALYEHASIASFSKFALELMALSAPPQLIVDACRAQADEVKHAFDCFSVASAIARYKVGPGALDINGAMEGEVTPQGVLVQTILDGCINETLAAAEATWLSEQCDIGPITVVLEKIAEDETRHAALAWKTIRWILEKQPELTAIAIETFEAARPSPPKTNTLQDDDQWIAKFGCMPRRERALSIEGAWQRVITPCAEALIKTSAT